MVVVTLYPVSLYQQDSSETTVLQLNSEAPSNLLPFIWIQFQPAVVCGPSLLIASFINELPFPHLFSAQHDPQIDPRTFPVHLAPFKSVSNCPESLRQNSIPSTPLVLRQRRAGGWDMPELEPRSCNTRKWVLVRTILGGEGGALKSFFLPHFCCQEDRAERERQRERQWSGTVVENMEGGGWQICTNAPVILFPSGHSKNLKSIRISIIESQTSCKGRISDTWLVKLTQEKLYLWYSCARYTRSWYYSQMLFWYSYDFLFASHSTSCPPCSLRHWLIVIILSLVSDQCSPPDSGQVCCLRCVS